MVNGGMLPRLTRTPEPMESEPVAAESALSRSTNNHEMNASAGAGILPMAAPMGPEGLSSIIIVASVDDNGPPTLPVEEAQQTQPGAGAGPQHNPARPAQANALPMPRRRSRYSMVTPEGMRQLQATGGGGVGGGAAASIRFFGGRGAFESGGGGSEGTDTTRAAMAEALDGLVALLFMSMQHARQHGQLHLQGQPPASDAAVAGLVRLPLPLPDGPLCDRCPDCSVCQESFDTPPPPPPSAPGAEGVAAGEVANAEGAAGDGTAGTAASGVDEPGVALAMPCAHIFHAQCLKTWLKISNTCPVCRYE
ncbi:hypothetical protein HK405_011180, partial [Cladochytrium tenue]